MVALNTAMIYASQMSQPPAPHCFPGQRARTPLTKAYPCLICGAPIPPTRKKGRPRTYCSEPCAAAGALVIAARQFVEAVGQDPLRARKALSRASSETFRAINAARAAIDAAEREVRERGRWG